MKQLLDELLSKKDIDLKNFVYDIDSHALTFWRDNIFSVFIEGACDGALNYAASQGVILNGILDIAGKKVSIKQGDKIFTGYVNSSFHNEAGMWVGHLETPDGTFKLSLKNVPGQVKVE